jgi:hypothetical protein
MLPYRLLHDVPVDRAQETLRHVTTHITTNLPQKRNPFAR